MFPICLPGPQLQLNVHFRWSIEGPPVVPNFRGHVVREVLILGHQGPVGADVPQELVRTGPAWDTTVCKDHKVPLSLFVELQDPAQVQPQL